MSNQLAIPFKKTYPVNIKEAARNWLQNQSTAHPDAFRTDIHRWQELRNEGVGGIIHVNRIDSALKYHAQLASILTKLPPDIQLDVPYAPTFAPSVVPITLKNLVFERAAVVFNLAALYSQLAESEDRSHIDGIKRAISYYQLAAGTLSFLRNSVLPKLVLTQEDQDSVLDLSIGFVHTLEWLMLAQAQECFWQKARVDNFKNGLMARLAANAASLYQLALTTVQNCSSSVRNTFPSQWISHIEVKRHHFDAVAQYRKSLDEFEASQSETTKYGFEIARLTQSQAEAQKAYDIARRGKVNLSVLQDAQSLLEAVRKSLTRAERDNDLIYHQEVPSASSLPQIAHAAIARTVVPPGLANPTSLIESNDAIFGELLGWGAQEAINIYNDRKKNLVEDKIVGVAQQLKRTADSLLQSLHLPASLEALERPIGLPPSLLKKADEVRLDDGPSKIETTLEEFQRLAQHNMDILNEAMDILDSEASEDENIRKNGFTDRLPSHEANTEFIEKQARYREILEQAAKSDDIVRQKWDDWEKNIIELTWDQEELEASVPASTSSSATPEGAETHQHATALRALLESLDTLEREIGTCVKRCQAVARADDVRTRIVKAASGFERLRGVEPAMFEDVSEEELGKYDKFIVDLQEMGTKQEEILESIKTRNDLFLKSRREDPAVKEREHALQSLDLSYHKYREIIHNLQEGIKFYNDLAGLLTQFKESCKTWGQQRKQEIYSVSRSMKAMSLNDKMSSNVATSPTQRPPISFNAADWEDIVPLAPPSPVKKKQRH